MSSKEFSDRFEGKWTKDTKTNERVLYLITQREVFNDVHHTLRLIRHMAITRANPKSAKNGNIVSFFDFGIFLMQTYI